jgi:hypothetical protein
MPRIANPEIKAKVKAGLKAGKSIIQSTKDAGLKGNNPCKYKIVIDSMRELKASGIAKEVDRDWIISKLTSDANNKKEKLGDRNGCMTLLAKILKLDSQTIDINIKCDEYEQAILHKYLPNNNIQQQDKQSIST